VTDTGRQPPLTFAGATLVPRLDGAYTKASASWLCVSCDAVPLGLLREWTRV
jgi:hypothetical protein